MTIITKTIHPGKYLYHKFVSKGITIATLADNLGVTRNTVSRLLNGKHGISSEMALRLSKLLPNTTIKYWMDIQQEYDIWLISKKSKSIKVKPLKMSL